MRLRGGGLVERGKETADMHPILFEMTHHGASRAIGTYGVLVALGVLVAGLGAVRTAARERMDVGMTLVLLALLAAAGLAGSWITFGIVELARTGSFDSVLAGGGLVFFGAPIAGVLAAWWLGPRLGLDVLKLADGSVPALAVGHALGRIGCLLGGCCYGHAFDGPWAIVYTHPLAPAAYPPIGRHPTPLYEAIALVILALAFLLARARSSRRGARTALYVAAYCVVRFVVELFRGDAIRGVWAGGMSTSQTLALGLALAMLATLALRSRTPTAGARRSRAAGSGSCA